MRIVYNVPVLMYMFFRVLNKTKKLIFDVCVLNKKKKLIFDVLKAYLQTVIFMSHRLFKT